jgi:hypothetical protein
LIGQADDRDRVGVDQHDAEPHRRVEREDSGCRLGLVGRPHLDRARQGEARVGALAGRIGEREHRRIDDNRDVDVAAADGAPERYLLRQPADTGQLA